MPDSTSHPSSTLVWLFGILLIGVVALYSWHNENQATAITAKDAEIAQSAQLVADTEQKLGHAQETEQTLRSEIDALATQHEAEKQGLMGKLDAAAQANQGLQGEMEALKTQHAQTLAAEQEKASQAYAELKAQHNTANQQIAALQADIEQLKQAMAEAAASHKAQLAETAATYETRMAEAQTAHETKTLELGQQLNEKIDFYRTALEGSDPERAAQLVAMELQMQADQQTIEEARQAMQAMQEKEAGLNEQLASANQAIAERDQALAGAGQRIEGLQAELTQGQNALAAFQQEHDTAVAQAAEKHAAVQQELQTTKESHAAQLAAGQQQLQAAEDSHAQTKAAAAAAMQDAEGRISDLTGKLQAETAALVALQQKHESIVAELSSSLDNTKQSLVGVESELSSTKDAAAQAMQASEQQIGEAKGKIAELEGILEQTKQTAAQDLETSQREGEEAVAYVRGVYTEFLKLGGQYTERGMLLNLAEEDLRFGVSKADLPDGEIESLDWISELLNKHAKLTVRIEGHTDSSGREETNLELSQKRADAVMQALVDRGVPAERVSSEGMGPARPIADNANSAGRSKNRRVEIYVIEN